MYTIEHDNGIREEFTDREFYNKYGDVITKDFYRPPFNKHYVTINNEKLVIEYNR